MYVNFIPLQAIVILQKRVWINYDPRKKWETATKQKKMFLKAFMRNMDVPVWPEFPDKIIHASECIDYPNTQNKLYLLSIQRVCTHFRIRLTRIQKWPHTTCKKAIQTTQYNLYGRLIWILYYLYVFYIIARFCTPQTLYISFR